MDSTPARRYWISLALMAVFGIGNIVFSYLNWRERAEMRAEAQMTRTMLDARARIQMKLIEAASVGRPLTLQEQTEINRLWVAAEYTKAEERP